MSAGLYFEDLAPGQVLRSPRAIRMERERMIEFATEFDPQAGHLSEEAAAGSPFGTLVASGWHTAAVSMRLMVDAMPVAGGSVGTGIEALKWLRPVRPGDELRAEVEILETRPSRSRPAQGIARLRLTTFNQNDEPVQELTSNVLFLRRVTAAS